jgi:cold-inducible RNA-binding protein
VRTEEPDGAAPKGKEKEKMAKKLFVGNLSWNTRDEGLMEAFSTFGEVTDAKVIVDRGTGRSRGFGFVTFADDNAGDDAISAMDGKELDGRTIRVSVAHDRRRESGGGSRFRDSEERW